MTNSKSNKNKKKNNVVDDGKSSKNHTKETSVSNVKDASNANDDKGQVMDNHGDAKALDNNKKANLKNAKDNNEDTETPIRPSANGGAYSEHFDPIPAMNKSENNETDKLSTVDISE